MSLRAPYIESLGCFEILLPQHGHVAGGAHAWQDVTPGIKDDHVALCYSAPGPHFFPVF